MPPPFRIFLLTVVATSVFAQGPLTPPGAPAPTMKSLAGAELTIVSALPAMALLVGSAESVWATAATSPGCIAQGNTDRGIDAGTSCTIIGCTAQGNTFHGIFAGTGCTITSCTASGNGPGMSVDTGHPCANFAY
jgi:parallel beta-helix repeat protein